MPDTCKSCGSDKVISDVEVFDQGLVAVVNDEAGFHGLITRIDVLNYLRKQQALKKKGEQPVEMK